MLLDCIDKIIKIWIQIVEYITMEVTPSVSVAIGRNVKVGFKLSMLFYRKFQNLCIYKELRGSRDGLCSI